MPKDNETKKVAFSLLEMLLVVAIITILAGIFAPALGTLIYRNNLDISADKVRNDLFRAQVLARSSYNDSAWGVYVTAATSTIFSGPTYAGRNIAQDESASLSGDISIIGTNEVVFLKSSGKPSASSSITIRQGNQEKIIIINGQGLIY